MLENILIIKHIHITLVTVSVSFFLLRFLLRESTGALPDKRILRMAPHIIDTCLLVSGAALMYAWHLSPLAANWLGLKLILLVVYVFLGLAAMKWCRTRIGRILACIAALITIVTMAVLAIAKPF